MKKSTKLKIIGCCLIPVGVALIISAFTVFAYHPFGDPFFDKVPHMGALIPGVFICFFALIFFVAGYIPSLTKFGAKLHSETMDHAGEDIGIAASKTVDAASPAIKKVTGAVKQGLHSQVYCKHCGERIDEDSKFCKHCAKKQ